MPMRGVWWSGSAAVQIAGLRPVRGLRTPARIGAVTWSRRVSKALMVRAAGGGTWWRRVLPGWSASCLPRSLRGS
jgi:hypothetical protein